jgi:hypothetical protein
MNLCLFRQLPVELQSKIMFNNFFITPTAKLIKDFIDDEYNLMTMLFSLDNLEYCDYNFYEYLIQIGFFNINAYSIEEVFLLIEYHFLD